jgi:hypothetical protein
MAGLGRISEVRIRGQGPAHDLRPGLRVADLAGVVIVDPKTVEWWIWITRGRLAHRTHRLAIARALDDHD